MLYHNNADAERQAVEHRVGDRARLGDAEPVHMTSLPRRRSTTSRARGMRKAPSIETVDPDGGEWRAELEPQFNFYMSGIGYVHPEWGHGHVQGRECARLRHLSSSASVNENDPRFLHVQAFVHARAHRAGRRRARRRRRAGAARHRAVCAARLQRHSRSRAMSDDLARQPCSLSARQARHAAIWTWTNLARIPGGASRETYRFRARYNGGTRTRR